jgi:methyl-accepting chemotaxis protein
MLRVGDCPDADSQRRPGTTLPQLPPIPQSNTRAAPPLTSGKDMKITQKISLSFAVISILVIALTVLVLRNLGSLVQADQWNDHTYKVLLQADQMLESMVNQETGVRGYLIGNNPAFLAPYNKGKAAFEDSYAQLRHLTADNPAQQQRLDAIRTFADDWRTNIAEREISLMDSINTAPQARSIEASGAGKKAMDGLRGVLGDFRQAEGSLLGVRAARKVAAEDTTRWVMLIGSFLAVLASIGFGIFANRSIARPASRLSDTMLRLAGGDNQVAIPGIGRKDEIGQMANAVEVFKQNALEKVRLEAETADQRAHAEEQRHHQEALKAEAAQQTSLVVDSLAIGLEKLSAGDLIFRLNQAFAAEYEKLRHDFNGAMDKLQETMSSISTNTQGVRSGAGEISQASDDLSRRTEQQAASLEETAAALDEITATVRKTAENANAARNTVSTAKDDAETSGRVVRETVTAMNGIENSSKQIGNIIGVIDEIAFQTNLLALNAGVEAARAGEAGRGFAVVATEVRALAQRSADAAKEIKALISTSSREVESGVRLVGETGKALDRIVEQVGKLNALIGDIAASAQEQATGLAEVNTAMNQMDQVTQQNAAMVEQATAASHSLAKEAETLGQLVAQFRIGSEAAAAPASGKRPTAGPKTPAPRLRPVQGAGGDRAAPRPAPARAMAGADEGDGWNEF